MKEITQQIVSTKVMKEDEALVEGKGAAPASIGLTEATKRPSALQGYTYKIKPPTADSALYITLNDIVLEDGSLVPFEIFINSKDMKFFSWVVALTRVISAVFRKGGDCTFLIKELKSVFDPTGGYYQKGTGVYMNSIVAEIAYVMEMHLKSIGIIKETLDASTKEFIEKKKAELSNKQEDTEAVEGTFPANAKQCVKCYQKSVILMDGCATCLNCGDSKCG